MFICKDLLLQKEINSMTTFLLVHVVLCSFLYNIIIVHKFILDKSPEHSYEHLVWFNILLDYFSYQKMVLKYVAYCVWCVVIYWIPTGGGGKESIS